MPPFKLKATAKVAHILTSCLLLTTSIAHAEHLELPDVVIKAQRTPEIKPSLNAQGDTASLLSNEAGVSLYLAGGVSSLPVIHGLADDRIRIKVDGMDLISACANHMNPPLSYIDPANVSEVKVYKGLSPVSLGGDSIAGIIEVNSAKPVFANAGEDLLVNGQINTFYHSNNDARGVNLSASVANESVYMRYTGATVEANNYIAGKNFKNASFAATGRAWLAADEVGSSAYESHNQALAFGVKHDNHLLEFKFGLQDIPYQGFTNQRMDMTNNESQQYNLSYQGQYDWGHLEARTYHEKTRHSMQFGDDKQYYFGDAPGMPMETAGSNTGLVLKADFELSASNAVKVGAELQRYRLDDWWPSSGSGMMMSPNPFWNIYHGERDRFDVFAEWDTKWNAAWSSQLGIRSSTVKMDTGNVQGYNNMGGMMGYGNPASPTTIPGAFNAADRARTDHNIDLTALANFTPDQNQNYEGGYALKTRSPNLYERYAWSNNNTMVMNMNNLYGDGNGYVGNLNLKPEKAHTLSVTGHWHDVAKENWQLNVTPYFTYVDDYINATSCANVGKVCPARNDGFVNLSLENQTAKLYGVDIDAKKTLGDVAGWGSFDAHGVLSYVKGSSNSSDDNLYNIMPLNAIFALEHHLGHWSNTIEAKLVDSKDKVQAVRQELKTAGYGLLNVYSNYEWKQASLDFAIMNVFDKGYDNPLGGAYLGQGATMGTDVPYGVAVPGMGRSINVGLTLKY
ncbi:MAG: TonB-dependent receptor plug domain-containing protein [Methylophilaceae bacterium]